MLEWTSSRRNMRAQLVGDVMRRLGMLAATESRDGNWQSNFKVTLAHYELRVRVMHHGGETTFLEVINGQRYGNDRLLDGLIAALDTRKSTYATRSKEELVTIFRDRCYRLFD